ncbi:MAG: outer membrane protein assembly factor BamE [Nitrosomonas sp. PRO4]|nr:outer membrane protein assembly factor BamE [Nitrosomonas sp. PRO4]
MAVKTALLFILLALAGCSYFPSILYRIDVQQGNVVTEEMLEKLKPGMTRSQVLFVLGSPLIIDTFHDNRWDYVYILREKGNLIEQKRLTIYFENDMLVNIENHLSFSKNPIDPKPVETIPETEKTQPNAALEK